jgi:hypothetical protein
MINIKFCIYFNSLNGNDFGNNFGEKKKKDFNDFVKKYIYKIIFNKYIYIYFKFLYKILFLYILKF